MGSWGTVCFSGAANVCLGSSAWEKAVVSISFMSWAGTDLLSVVE